MTLNKETDPLNYKPLGYFQSSLLLRKLRLRKGK